MPAQPMTQAALRWKFRAGDSKKFIEMGEPIGTAAIQPMKHGERRLVSVLFSDMVNYTAIVDELGAEQALAFTQMLQAKLADTVAEQGGTVGGFAGDSIMALFGIPEAQEDAALRACRAALSIQAAFAAAADEIEASFGVRPNMRVGVSSGVAVMAPMKGEGAEPTVVGNTVNLASRIQALAPIGGCLVCDATRRLVEWLVELSFHDESEIKGVAKPQKLWRLVSIREGATRFDASLARGLSPYVGRHDELAALSEALDQSRDGFCVIDLVAEPGLGKTRLVFEFLQRAKSEDATILRGYCMADRQQVPFFPFLEVVRSSFRLRDEHPPAEIAQRLEKSLCRLDLYSAENLGLLLNFLGLKPPAGSLDGLDGVLIGLRTRDLLTDLLKARCRTGTVVLLLEDIHWIDDASAQLLRQLIENCAPPNLLVIHSRRPEYHPDWCGSPAVRSLALKPLAPNDIMKLARARLGVEVFPEALIREVTERAGGNPLFGEEILSFLIEQGSLRIEGGKAEFDAESGKSALPASMQGLLHARMDRLPNEDRALLQAAAAIGRRFDPGLLSVIVEGADVGEALQRLQAQDIVYREASSSDYLFKHVLLRDSVYQSLLSRSRAELHLSIGEALEKRNGNRLSEAAELLAYHFGLTDRTDLAFTYSAMAGAKSLGVFSLGEANRYFASALVLYEQDPACASEPQLAGLLAHYALSLNLSLRVKTMIELANRFRPVLGRSGDSCDHVSFLHHYISCLVCSARYRDALSVQQELSAMAARLGDPRSIAYALVSELSISCYCAPISTAEFRSRRLEAEEVLEHIDDAYIRNFYLAILGWDEVSRGRVAEAREAADRMTTVGLSMNDPRALGYGTAMNALIAMLGDDHEKALEMSEQALSVSRVEFERAIASAARISALVSLNKPGAIQEVERYLDRCAENGWTLFSAGPDVMLGLGLAISGRIDQGLRHIETAIARREQEGYQTAADWYRLFMCEVYLEILSGKGGASPGVLLRNARALLGVFLFGAKRIVSLIDRVRSNPQFAPDGHYIARTEVILGLLYKARKKKALALQHLTEARRIVEPSGRSPMLARIDLALADLERA